MVALVQQSATLSTSTGGVLTWSPGTTPTVSNLISGQFVCEGTAPAAGDCKDSSATPKTFTLDASAHTTNSIDSASVHSLIVPSGLTTPLKNANSSTFKEGRFTEWSGLATTSVVDQGTGNHNDADTDTAGNSGTINTGANAALALAALNILWQSGTPVNAGGANWSADWNDAGGLGSMGNHDTTSIASQTSFKESWTWTTAGRWAAAIVSYNAAGGGGGSYSLFDDANLLGNLASITGGFQ